MGFFSKDSSSKTVLGIDIGATSIKVVEMKNENNRCALMTYGYAEASLQMNETFFDDPQKTGLMIADICKSSGVKSSSAMMSLQNSSVFSTILSVQTTKDQKELNSIIDTEISKLTPLPIDEMVTYQTKLEEKTEDKFSRVLVSGASKTLVQKYLEMCKVAKLSLQAIDTEAFALIRSLIGKDRGSVMIIDIGSRRTDMFIVEKGIPFVSRTIELGGDMVTSYMQEVLQINKEEAERTKQDLGDEPMKSGLPGGLPKMLEFLMLPLVNEIKFAFSQYSKMELSQFKKVEKMVITGGSSHLPRIPEYLSEVLNLNVYRADPWARVLYPSEISSVLEEIGPRFSVAVGLSMRESAK